MLFKEYQARTEATAIYDDDIAMLYTALGLCSEAGEVAGKIKKVLRDNNGIFTPAHIQDISSEIGDVLWYVARLAASMSLDLETIAKNNLEKLDARKNKSTISGSGDNR